MSRFEKFALQCAVAAGCLVPIGAGAGGVLLGPSLIGAAAGAPDFDSHFRYLSGLLLAIGLGFASTIPRIEAHSRRFGLLTIIVVTGGLGRLVSVAVLGSPSSAMMAALTMELLITPALAAWQRRVANARG